MPLLVPRAVSRAAFCALVTGTLATLSALAAPLSLAPPSDADNVMVAPAAQPDAPPAPPVRLAARGPMGGGFIQCLFGGDDAGTARRDEAPAAPVAAAAAEEPARAPMDP